MDIITVKEYLAKIALYNSNFSEDLLKKIFSENALKYLKGEETSKFFGELCAELLNEIWKNKDVNISSALIDAISCGSEILYWRSYHPENMGKLVEIKDEISKYIKSI